MPCLALPCLAVLARSLAGTRERVFLFVRGVKWQRPRSPGWADCDSGVAGGVGTIISNGAKILPVSCILTDCCGSMLAMASVGARRTVGFGIFFFFFFVTPPGADCFTSLEGPILRARVHIPTYSHISCLSKTFREAGQGAATVPCECVVCVVPYPSCPVALLPRSRCRAAVSAMLPQSSSTYVGGVQCSRYTDER